MPSRPKIAPLQLGLVDSDRAGAELPAVEHEVVGLAAHRQRIGSPSRCDVVGMRLRERVVAGLRAPGRRVDADEHREVDDPHVAVRALVHRRAAEVVAQRGRAPRSVVAHSSATISSRSPGSARERAISVGLLVVG